ncbi:MAG TPA: rhomboid family intramembrane serine protease [Bacteroidota bacterium]
MIPLRDKNPTRLVPYVNVSFIIINVLVFAYELTQGGSIDDLIRRFAVIPANITLSFGGHHLSITALRSLFTSMFFHAGWLHLGGNMLYLWVFGDNVEDKLGHARYVIFYLLCGIVSSALYVYVDPHSQVPTIGASGAISGVLGAYILLFPKARVLTVIPIFIFLQFVELPAILVLGLWFVLQLFSGLASLGQQTAEGGGVAWWAHIGGFAAGLVLIFPMRKFR